MRSRCERYYETILPILRLLLRRRRAVLHGKGESAVGKRSETAEPMQGFLAQRIRRHTDREAVQSETPERNRANQNGVNRMTYKIFRKVHCKAYLQKFSDGVHLECYEIDPESGAEIPTTLSRWSADTKLKVTAFRWEKEIMDLSNFEADYVVKQYRRRVEEEFDGFLVGVTRITTSAQIGTDYYDDTYREYHRIFKIAETERVGVVYFKNNMKRYVPLEDIKYVELVNDGNESLRRWRKITL